MTKAGTFVPFLGGLSSCYGERVDRLLVPMYIGRALIGSLLIPMFMGTRVCHPPAVLFQSGTLNFNA